MVPGTFSEGHVGSLVNSKGLESNDTHGAFGPLDGDANINPFESCECTGSKASGSWPVNSWFGQGTNVVRHRRLDDGWTDFSCGVSTLSKWLW